MTLVHTSMERRTNLSSPTETMIGEVPMYEDEPTLGLYVYICNLCGQPLPPESECNSGLHVGPDGKNQGQSVRSTDLVYLLRCVS